MKQVKLLFLLGLSLISAPVFPMSGRLGAAVKRIGPKVKAAAQVGANRAKAAAQNVKTKAFPTFCRAVNVGMSGAVPSVVLGVARAEFHVLSAEDIKKLSADSNPAFKGGVKEVDDKLATLVLGSLNIPLFVGEGEEKEEQALLNGLQHIKAAGGLTCLSALRTIPLNCGAMAGRMIIMTSGMHKLLSSPELFIDTEEYEKFCESARAIIQHEGGHCLEQHSMLKAVCDIGAPIALHMATKRLGPIAKQLAGMNPVAKTKMGMLGRAVGGGIAKYAATNAGLLLLSRAQEHRADSYIDDAHKKNMINFMYSVSGLLWQSKNPAFCSICNLHPQEVLDVHPHPARRIMRICGSLEQGAEIIVKAEREEQQKIFERRKEQMSALKTEAEKIEFLVKHYEYPQDISTWNETPEEALKAEYDFAEEKIQHCLNDNAQQWINLKATVIKDMEDALSITHNLKGAVREKANEYMQQYARYRVEQEVKRVEQLQKRLLELPEEEQVQFFETNFDMTWATVQLKRDGKELLAQAEKVAAIADSYTTRWYVAELLKYREEKFKENNPEAESQSLSQSFQAKMFPLYYEALDELWQEREAAVAAKSKEMAEAQKAVEKAEVEQAGAKD